MWCGCGGQSRQNGHIHTNTWLGFAGQTSFPLLFVCFFFSKLDFEQISNLCFAPLQHFQPSALAFLIKGEAGCWGVEKKTELKKKMKRWHILWCSRGERTTILHIEPEKKKSKSLFAFLKTVWKCFFSIKSGNINNCAYVSDDLSAITVSWESSNTAFWQPSHSHSFTHCLEVCVCVCVPISF